MPVRDLHGRTGWPGPVPLSAGIAHRPPGARLLSDAVAWAGDGLAAARAFFPQEALARFGVILLALAPAGLVWARLDPREMRGESVATKPTKFLLSIGVHALTLSWAFNLVEVGRRDAFLPLLTVWTVIASSTWELLCIGSQAARGRMSHFNHRTRYDSLVFASMGLFATLLVAANLPLAWEIAARPRSGSDPTKVVAMVAGLVVSCFLGGVTGIMMGARNRHGVGGRQTGRLPLLGWSTSSGDLRAPHFLGIHAVQALPLLAALAPAGPNGPLTLSFLAAGCLYVLLIVGTLVQALMGRPLVASTLLRRWIGESV